jgi:hypothetical protein
MSAWSAHMEEHFVFEFQRRGSHAHIVILG